MRRKTSKPNQEQLAELAELKAKLVLVKCGDTLINPKDVSAIRKVKKGLYIVKTISEPLWLDAEEVAALLPFFNIVEDKDAF